MERVSTVANDQQTKREREKKRTYPSYIVSHNNKVNSYDLERKEETLASLKYRGEKKFKEWRP